MARAAQANAEAIGMRIDSPASTSGGSGRSTDFGNVSQVMPAFAMRFAIGREPIPGHSRLLTEAAKTDLAHENAIATAKVLAITACDLPADSRLIDSAQAEFATRGA